MSRAAPNQREEHSRRLAGLGFSSAAAALGLQLPCTCHVVSQLEDELVHFKGGRERLDQAGGLDGACHQK